MFELRHRRTSTLLAVVASSVLFAREAAAQPAGQPTDADVRAIFAEGRQLMTDKHLPEACAKFEDARQKRPEWIGVTLGLAECQERLGDLSRALELFERAEQLANKAKDRSEDAKVAREGAEALRGLPRLVLRIPDEVKTLPELTIRQDGRTIEADRWASPIIVRASSHHITVSASGHKDWEIDVDATGSTAEIPVDIARLEATTVAPGATGSATSTARVHSTAQPAVTSSTGPVSTTGNHPTPLNFWRAIPAWSWVAGATGFALGQTSLGFLIDELIVQHAIDTNCKQTPCTHTPDFFVNDANKRLFRSFYLFAGLGGGGLLGLGIAALGIVTAPKTGVAPGSRQNKVTATWAPAASLGPGQWSLGVTGQF